MLKGDLLSFCLKRSTLLRKRMIDVLMNHRELTTESKSTRDSIMRFWLLSSSRTWSYSLRATQKMIEVTFSKQWIHFLRSLLCPPTSNMLNRSSVVSPANTRSNSLNAERAHLEFRFVDTSRLGTRSKDICLCRKIVRCCYPVHFIEEAEVSVPVRSLSCSNSLWC